MPDVAAGSTEPLSDDPLIWNHVDVFSGATGQLLYSLHPGHSLGESFGRSIAGALNVDGKGTPGVLVGAPSARIDETENPGGAVYVFCGTDGTMLRRIPNPRTYGYFGYSMCARSSAVENRTLVFVGDWLYYRDDPLQKGAAYAIDVRTGQTFRKFRSPTGHRNGNFGVSVVVLNSAGTGKGSPARFLIGANGECAWWWCMGTSGPGQVHLFPACRADWDVSDSVTSADFFLYIEHFFTDPVRADFNADGVTDSRDFFEFLMEFFAGCP